jgi:uncharacterized protein YlzI (FlbEa/FlbD family)
MKLVRLTQGKSGKHHYLNPDHVRSVTETDGGTLITFGDGGTLIVNESLTDTVDEIQGAQT